MSKSKKQKTLIRLIDHYDRDKEVSQNYLETVRCSVKRFEKYLGRTARVKDLKAKKLNAWMQYELKETPLSDRTRSNGLTHLITLWKYTGKKLDRKKIRRVKVRKKNPEAWTVSDLETVTDAMRGLPGRLSNGIPRALYFPTITWFAFDTGLRRRDIWNFRFDLFDDHRAVLSQHKTNHLHVVQITESTMEETERIVSLLKKNNDPGWNTPFAWPQSESQFYYWFRKARKLANVDPDIVNRVLQHLRRTGATAVERSGGKAWQYLGHTAPGLDRLSYVDQVKTVKPIVPSRESDGQFRIHVA
jgi:integrase